MIPQNYPLHAVWIGPDDEHPFAGPVIGWHPADDGTPTLAPVVAVGPSATPVDQDRVVGYLTAPPNEYDVAKFMGQVNQSRQQQEAAA